MVKDKRAFNAFGFGLLNLAVNIELFLHLLTSILGRNSCPGKQLGLMEVRVVLTMLLQKFEFGFSPGHDENRVINDMKDAFLALPGDLELIFRPLEKA